MTRKPKAKPDKTIEAGATAAGKPDAGQQSKRGGPVGNTGNDKANKSQKPRT